MKLHIKHISEIQKEVLYKALTFVGDLAIGEEMTIDRKMEDIDIHREDQDNKYLTVYKLFRKVFYKDRSNTALRVVSSHRLKIINAIAYKLDNDKLIFTDDEVRLMMYALEHYSRIGMGQFDYLDFLMAYLGFEFDNCEEKEALLKEELKKIYFPNMPKNSSYSINNKSVHKNIKISWDIYQVLRYEYETDKWKNIEVLYMRTPKRSSNLESLIEVEVEETF